MRIKSKYRRIFKLMTKLEKHKIDFEFYVDTYEELENTKSIVGEPIKYQILIPVGDKRISIIEGFGSYGQDRDLLEIMFSNGAVIGYLDSQEAYLMIKEDLKSLGYGNNN